MNTDRLRHEGTMPRRVSTESVDKAAFLAAAASVGAAQSRAAQAMPAGRHDHFERHALPINDFVDQLRLEMRRTMRSGAALSIVLYRVGVSPDATLEVLYRAKRETDLLGHIGDDMLAVLCPDTGADGIRAFAKKVGQGCDAASFEVAVASFPDPLFHTLTASRAPGLAHRAAAALSDTRIDTRDGYSLKRALDVVGALTALALLAPVMLVVAALVALTSPGPVVFRQTRLGRGGKPFTFYKFRSMVTDAGDSVHRAFVAKFVAGEPSLPLPDDVAGGSAAAPYKLRADPRVTPLGAFLRRSSLDELPQFFNVLKGDMSLVGPRPAIPYEIDHYQSWHLRRILTTRPGITGLWQVEGRSRVTFNEMVRMDLRYIRECSLGLDLRIILKTFVVVFRAEGAA